MDITDLIATEDTTVTLSGPTLSRLLETLRESNSQRDTYRLTVESLEGQLKTVTGESTAAHNEVLALRVQVKGLEEALAAATKPPTPVPPAPAPTPAPIPIPAPTIPSPLPRGLVISKTEISGLAGLTIEKSLKTPDDKMYAQVRDVLTWAAGRGFNVWRGFFNADEVRQSLRLQQTDPGHLPAFGRKLGLQFIADTVGTALAKLDLNGQREYLKGLEAMGALAVVFNDANDEETLDLVEWTQRVRTVLPNMPIIASLTGTANIASYPMFDFFEAQTFGTREELSQFLGRAFNIFCLDARKGISATDLSVRAAIVLAAKPKAFFYYTDESADWLNITLDKAGAIKKMIDMWKTLR